MRTASCGCDSGADLCPSPLVISDIPLRYLVTPPASSAIRGVTEDRGAISWSAHIAPESCQRRHPAEQGAALFLSGVGVAPRFSEAGAPYFSGVGAAPQLLRGLALPVRLYPDVGGRAMPDQVPEPPPRLRVHLMLCAGCALVALGLIAVAIFLNSLFFFLPESIRSDANFDLVTRIAMIVIAVWVVFRIGIILEKRWRALDKSLSPGPPPPETTNGLKQQQQDILDSIALVRQCYSKEAIFLFTKMLAGYQVRVTERAELLGTSVRMYVSTEHAMTLAERSALTESTLGGANGTSPSIPVPVLKVTKGTLLDNLEVTDHEGSSISVLSQKEARGLVALTLETLFYLTFTPAAPKSPEEANQVAALWSLRRLVGQTVRITTKSSAADDSDDVSDHDWEVRLRVAFRRSIAKVNRPGEVNPELLRDLEKFCCFFARNYVIAADLPIPPGVRFIVKYSKTVPLYGRTSVPNQRRMRLGLSPYKFWVPLNLAFTAESYHFHMDIGEAQFVADQYFADSSGDPLSLKKLYELAANGHLRIRDGSGLHYAHLYTRGLHKSIDPINLVTVIKFEEAPPGALGATTIVATISAVLVSLMTFIHPGDGPNADTAALLFAVPLFAATLVGYSIDRVQRSSLATFGSLVITGTTALLGAALFGLTPDLFSVTHVRALGLFHIPSINIGGLVIAIAAIGNVAFLRWLLKYKTRRYLDMLQRWDKPHFAGRQRRELNRSGEDG